MVSGSFLNFREIKIARTFIALYPLAMRAAQLWLQITGY
jgi:hypothetical protein